MKVKQGDQAKAAILIVAIIGVMGFSLKSVLFKGNPAPASSAPATKAPETVVASSGMEEPAVTVTNLTPKSGAAPTVTNPFRRTVAEAPVGGNTDSARWTESKLQGQRPSGPIMPMPGLAPFSAQVPDNVEFRLDGVLVGGNGVAVVSRAGETEFLEVGAKAAYGYTITAINAAGIRLTQKSKSRWIRVGERLDPPGFPSRS